MEQGLAFTPKLAGESWASVGHGLRAAPDALMCALWDQAELWHMRNAERYRESSFPDWYFFCKRSGHGNLAAARETTEQYIDSRAANPGGRNNLKGCFYWLDGQHEKAKAAFTSRLQTIHESSRFGFSCARRPGRRRGPPERLNEADRRKQHAA